MNLKNTMLSERSHRQKRFRSYDIQKQETLTYGDQNRIMVTSDMGDD